MSDDLIGQTLGSFTILSLLGQGGMARVYRARQHNLEREVALKVIRRIPGDAHDIVARFQREKQVMQKLEHSHILPIYDYASNADYLWIAMRLVEGGTLGDHPVPPEKTVTVVRQLASALDFAHSLGVIHRDIKPHNVLVEKEGGHLYLTDFGVAKMLEQEGLTAPGTTVGTPEYMSPEQLQGKELDGRSDQYSLAVMAYQFATGRLPFEGSLLEVMTGHIKSLPTPPHKHNPEIPEAASQAILKAMSKGPAERFNSIQEFAQALEEAMGPGRTHQSRPIVPGPNKPGALKWGVLATVAVVAGLLGIFGRPSTSYKAGILVYEANSGKGHEIQLRSAQGQIKSLGSGVNPHFWPGGSEVVLNRGGQLIRINLEGKVLGVLVPGEVEEAVVTPDATSLILEAGKKLQRLNLSKNKPAGNREDLVEEGSDPSLAPDGSELAFAAEGAIWVLNLKSGLKRTLTAPAPGERDAQPAWSPDGQRLVYQRKSASGIQLRLTSVKNPGDDQPIKLPNSCGQPGQPSWAPNSLLVFRSDKGIYSAAPDGSRLTRLIEPPAGVKLQSPQWGP